MIALATFVCLFWYFVFWAHQLMHCIHALAVFGQNYMKPLSAFTRSLQPVISTRDCEVMFPRVMDLCDVHEFMLSQMETLLEEWSSRSLVGDLFDMLVCLGAFF